MSTHESASAVAVQVAPRVARSKPARRTTTLGPFVLAGAFFSAVMVTHLVNFGTDDLRIRLLDANSDSSWSHMLIAGTLVVGSAVAVLKARQAGLYRRKLWGGSAVILAFLSISELTSLHAKIDNMSWGKLVYAPILIVLSVCLWRLSRGSRFRLVIGCGLVTLVISFAIHVLGPHLVHTLGYGYNSWAYQVKVGLKQATELAGWLLVAWGLSRLAFGTSDAV